MAFAEAKVEEPEVDADAADGPQHEEDPPPQPTEATVISAEAKVEEPEVKAVAADPPKHEEDPPPQRTEATVISAEAKVEEPEVKAVVADPPKHEETKKKKQKKKGRKTAILPKKGFTGQLPAQISERFKGTVQDTANAKQKLEEHQVASEENVELETTIALQAI
ncbi:unnamed protein product [Durusdinium trenchii]|uniref:Uncharacterized protein n=1 Tax=Durusdinium trenchii TaxID=1381693 RepID=A0ABP0HW42_9DINO